MLSKNKLNQPTNFLIKNPAKNPESFTFFKNRSKDDLTFARYELTPTSWTALCYYIILVVFKRITHFDPGVAIQVPCAGYACTFIWTYS